MVQVTRILLKTKIRQYLKTNFIDSLRINVRGGPGGMGYPKYGGIGGKGGDVFAVAKEEATLKALVRQNPTKRFKAEPGENSGKNRLLGAPGKDITIEIPIGVTVVDEFGRKLGELNEEGSTLLLARGGTGGNPVTHWSGEKGQAHTVVLDLKLIADVGLVGFPNAGKSTLLRAISRAKPKVASYPFTTVKPHLGVMQYSDQRQITMADLPGLIEGAHANIGMGHHFLKHVERTKLLLLVCDIQGFQLSHKHDYRSCLETIVLLNKELELYRDDLLDKPVMIVINKMDTEGAVEKYDKIKDALKNLSGAFEIVPPEMRPERALEFIDIMAISAATDVASVERVKTRIREILDFYAELNREDKETEVISKLRTRMSPVGPQML